MILVVVYSILIMEEYEYVSSTTANEGKKAEVSSL